MKPWMCMTIAVLTVTPLAAAFQTTQPSGEGILGDTYVSGGATQADPPTGVEGGVEGSAYVTRTFLDRYGVYTTHWIFVESSSATAKLTLRLMGGTGTKLEESRWGYHLISQPWGRYSLAGEYNQAELSSLLADFYERRRAPRHAPFLTGKGWTLNSQGIRGACKADVNRLAQRLQFTVVTDGENESGHVVWQDPRGGTLLSGLNPTVTVRYDGEACTPQSEPGFAWTNALLLADDNDDGFIHWSAAFDPTAEQDLSTPCGQNGPARIFRLPVAEPGTLWRIGRFDLGGEIALAAFTESGREPLGCASGNDPELRVRVPAKGGILVVVQLPEKRHAWFNLYAHRDTGKRIDLTPVGVQPAGKKD